MVGADELIVYDIEHVCVGERETVAGKKYDGVEHKHSHNSPRQTLAGNEEGHGGAYAIAKGQSRHDAENSDTVEVGDCLKEGGIVKYATEEEAEPCDCNTDKV